jgi:acetyl-CoA carboxylase biotin carboxylase subunit
MPALLSAATITGADAIHPGVGFLSENAEFAAMVEEHGFVFIGPRPEHLALMGDKVEAKRTARALGLPVVPGSEDAVTTAAEAESVAKEIGYPIGGGGRGMKLVYEPENLARQLELARSEARANFGSDAVYMERFLAHPRHIEVQILADSHGKVLHLGERDCSLQRRHQKLVEEAPSPALNSEQRAQIGALVTKAIGKLGYESAGTIEFLFENGQFYFMEMNTRLQVEHPVTEAITGIDLVREQIRIAAGTPLDLRQEDITFSGHAIECRINAEHPTTFAPSPGTVSDYHAPGGLGVRVDSGLYSGYRVPPQYDSLIAKLIVHGQTRNECLMRLRRALEEFVIEGVDTSIPLHRELIAETDFINGTYDIAWLERYVDRQDE